jgi:hypothetical protein
VTVEILLHLLKPDGDEQAEDYCCDVDEEFAPGAGGVVGGVNFEHGCWLRCALFEVGGGIVSQMAVQLFGGACAAKDCVGGVFGEHGDVVGFLKRVERVGDQPGIKFEFVRTHARQGVRADGLDESVLIHRLARIQEPGRELPLLAKGHEIFVGEGGHTVVLKVDLFEHGGEVAWEQRDERGLFRGFPCGSDGKAEKRRTEFGRRLDGRRKFCDPAGPGVIDISAQSRERGGFVVVELVIEIDDMEVLSGFDAKVVFQLMALVTVVEGLDGLLETDGDEQADGDGGDMDEEVSPGAGGVVGGMDVEHGGGFLGRGGFGRFWGIRWWQREGVGVGHEVGCDECIAEGDGDEGFC